MVGSGAVETMMTCVTLCRRVACSLILCLQLWTGATTAQPADDALGPVDLRYFGLVMNRTGSSQPWPTVPFGSWRLWDAYVTWPYLEPARGKWQFQSLDRMIDEAQEHKVAPLLVLAHSPGWASARPNEPSAYKPGYAAEPASLEDWRNYVRTVATRYKGRIKEYEIWNEPSDRSHFTGTVTNLIDLTCSAYKVLKEVDPAIKVVSGANAGGGRHIQHLDDFLAGGGAHCIDVVAHHFYVPRFGPEAMVDQIRQVKAVMRKRGVTGLPLWNTESGWWIANTDGTPDHAMVTKGGWRKLDADMESGAVIQRAFLLARAEGVERFYWYAWSNRYGWGLTDSQGNPKPATIYWNKVSDLMLGKRVISCQVIGAGGECDLTSAGGVGRTVRWRDTLMLIPREGAGLNPNASAAMPK